MRHVALVLLAFALLSACAEPAAGRPTAAPTSAPVVVATGAPTSPPSSAEAPPSTSTTIVTPTSRETPAAESQATATPTAPPSITGPAPSVATPVTPPPPPPVQFSADTRTVVIDPGHGGEEVGAANFGVVEKHSNLDMAFRVERLLAERGLRPVLTRREDVRASSAGLAAAPTGFSAQRIDLQARVDLANSERAAAYVSIHSNGSNSGAERGIEVYYNSQRPHAAENLRLAQAVHDGVLAELNTAGYGAVARGVKDDSCLRAFQGRCFPLFVLGPDRVTTRDEILRRGGNPDALLPPGASEFRSRATQMPAALVELYFISNAEDAAILRSEPAREAMARGIARGIARFLRVE